jgi:hypothetical protein
MKWRSKNCRFLLLVTRLRATMKISQKKFFILEGKTKGNFSEFPQSAYSNLAYSIPRTCSNDSNFVEIEPPRSPPSIRYITISAHLQIATRIHGNANIRSNSYFRPHRAVRLELDNCDRAATLAKSFDCLQSIAASIKWKVPTLHCVVEALAMAG